MSEVGFCERLFRNGGMALIKHSDGYAVAELLYDEIVRGDELKGTWSELGSTRILNQTQGCRQDVYLQGSWASAQAALNANGGP
jgi:hypothetical protein